MTDDLTVVGVDGIRRSFDEHFDTMMDVEQDPSGAHHAIQNQHDRIEELEAEIARLRQLVPRPDQTRDELVWRDHMRGVPLEALAKEFGVTRERMRHTLKRTAERRLHLKGETDE